jgi:hypothetical protein
MPQQFIPIQAGAIGSAKSMATCDAPVIASGRSTFFRDKRPNISPDLVSLLILGNLGCLSDLRSTVPDRLRITAATRFHLRSTVNVSSKRLLPVRLPSYYPVADHHTRCTSGARCMTGFNGSLSRA